MAVFQVARITTVCCVSQHSATLCVSIMGGSVSVTRMATVCCVSLLGKLSRKKICFDLDIVQRGGVKAILSMSKQKQTLASPGSAKNITRYSFSVTSFSFTRHQKVVQC